MQNHDIDIGLPAQAAMAAEPVSPDVATMTVARRFGKGTCEQPSQELHRDVLEREVGPWNSSSRNRFFAISRKGDRLVRKLAWAASIGAELASVKATDEGPHEAVRYSGMGKCRKNALAVRSAAMFLAGTARRRARAAQQHIAKRSRRTPPLVLTFKALAGKELNPPVARVKTDTRQSGRARARTK
jgi:hypothetical protein